VRLPIDDSLPEIVAALRDHRCVVLEAPPGAGKSTRVPVALDDAGFSPLVMLEPRRIAARALAARMADERGERVGASVGYQVRFDKKHGKDTRVLVVTEGILTRRLLSDPLLEGTSVVVLDELHERSVHTDLTLAFCKELLDVRDDFRVVAMSATIDTERIAAYLGDAVVVRAEGRPFEVSVEHQRPERDEPLEVQVRRAVRGLIRADDDDDGDILVFLPGAREIQRAVEALRALKVDAVPLYGALSRQDQDAVLDVRHDAPRRVICATNLAETSLTVPRVTAVVDSGLARNVELDAKTGLEHLVTERTSQRSAVQRAGRAGRLAPGRVVRLYSAAEQAQRRRDDPPEIARTDLAGPLLSLLRYAPGDPRGVDLLDPPDASRFEQAERVLEELGAARDHQLTERGVRLSELPVHPRLGAVLLEGASRGQSERAALLCASISERDPSVSAANLDERVDRMEEWDLDGRRAATARSLGLDVVRAKRFIDVVDQLKRLAPDAKDAAPAISDGALLLAGFQDRVGLVEDDQVARLADGRRVSLRGCRDDVTKLFVAPSVDKHVRIAAPVTRAELEDAGALRLEASAVFDPDTERAVGVQRARVGAIVLEEKRPFPAPGEALDAAIIEAARARAASILQLSGETDNAFARVELAARAHPDLPWPDASEAARSAALDELCAGLRTLKAVRDINWKAWLHAQLDPRAFAALREFPERVEVPSGRKVTLDYTAARIDPHAPVLAVKIQELFGLTRTPTFARGQPVLLHLLAPNGRPAQITRDLPGFWERSYAEVRKDLRRRYPKHSWPDDPANAEPWRPKRRNRR
jgi:ATP-dependent helicase HrpB